MSGNAKTIIIEILSLIDYKKDNDEYAKRLIRLSQLNAITNLYLSLSKEKQELFEKELAASQEPEAIVEKLYTFFDKDTVEKKIDEEFTSLFQKFLEAIAPKMSFKQKRNIKKFLANKSSQLVTP